MSATSNGTKLATCQWCGMMHGPMCPSVKAIEYYQDGAIKRVEFLGPQDATWQVPALWQQPSISVTKA